MRDALLPAEATHDWSKMEYSYYLLRGNGLDERIVMDAINRAKRRFFLRPGYMARHVGDVAQIAMTKQNIVWQVLSADAVRRAGGRHVHGRGAAAIGRGRDGYERAGRTRGSRVEASATPVPRGEIRR